MIKQAVGKTLQFSGRKIWDLSPYSVQSALRPLFQYNKLKRAKAKIGDHNLLKMRSKRFTKEIDDYWMEYYGKRIDPTWHHIYANFTGVEDVRFIPQDVWSSELHDFFNDVNFRNTTYKDKNLFDNLFSTAKSPKTIYKKSRGKYLDQHNNVIDQKSAINLLVDDENDKIIKPSMADGGARVIMVSVVDKKVLLNNKTVNINEIENILRKNNTFDYAENYIVQNKVLQHDVLASPHQYSLNTIRIVTFRWKYEIKILFKHVRFGNNKQIIDKRWAGSLTCSVNGNGNISSSALDQNLNRYFKHPFSSVEFSALGILPSHEMLCNLAVEQHKKALHMDFAAWDIAIEQDGNPCLLEINSDPFVPFLQLLCGKTLFGEITDDVLRYVKDSR